MSDKKLTVSEFAGKIKAKYPEYKDINDLELAQKIVAKYPEYESVVVFEEDSKKKEKSQEPFQFGVSDTPSAVQSEEPPKEDVDTKVEAALAFNDAFNPVGRALKKVPVLSELNSGIESMVGSAFKLGEMFVRENVLAYATANPAYAIAQNAINSAAPIDNKLADALGFMGDAFMESSSRAVRQKYKDYGIPDNEVELGIIGNLAEGNVSSAAKLTASTMVQQIPQLAVMAATGGTAGGVVLGATAAGGKYAEIQDDPTLSSQEKALYSLAIGAAEGIAENIFKTDVNQFRRIFSKKETTEAFKKEIKKQLKKETLWRSSREEATEEFLVAVTDNLIESGLKGNLENWDREAVLEIADNTLIGGLMGGGVYSVSRGVNAIGTTKNEREISRAKKDVVDLYAKLEDATDEQKPIIEELIEERLGFIIDNQSEDARFYKNFSDEDLKQVSELNKQIRKASKKYNLAASDSQKNVIKKELDELRGKKAEIENKYSESPTKYIKDGKEVPRAEFIDMLNQATPEDLATGQWGVQNDDEVEQLLMSKLPQDDRKEEERVPGTEQEGEAPIKEEPIQEPSPEEAAPSRVVQEAEEVTPTEEVDTEAVKIEKETISDAEFRIEDLQSEINIEKGNIKEAKDKSKEDIAAVRKSDLTADEKKERIAEIKAELQDAIDEMNGNIGIYKEDISAFKSDIRKAQKKLAKLEAPKAVAAVKEPTPSVPEEAQIKPEDVVSEKDAQGNERFFAAYPVKDKPIKAFFEVKTDKDGNIIRVSDKSYGPARKTLKRRLLAEAVAKPKGKIKEQLETVATPVSAIGKKADSMVSNFNNALKSIGADNVAVYAVSDGDMKSITGSTSRAQFRVLEDGTSAIILNTDKATLGSLSHEMLHAYVKAVKLSGDKVVSFTNQIKTQLAKGNNSEKALAKKLQEFQEAYIQREVYGKGLTLDDPNISEEFLAEYAAQIKDGIDVQKMSLSTIEKIRKAVAKIVNDVLGIKVDDTAIKSKEEAFDFINGFLDALEGRGDLTAKINPERSAVVKNKNPYEASRLQLDVPVGSRIANKPLKDARTIAIAYMESKGLKHTDGSLITKIDKKLAKRISDAYAAMKNNPKDSEVSAAYKAMAEETIDQYEAIIKGGYKLEVNNNEPYNKSNELIEDLRKNKNMRIFSTDSGFGDAGITADQRKDNPLLAETKYKDVNGRTLLVNDIFRFVHDFFGHAERGNGFGPIGEENAWDVHSRMYSPLARKALTAETRGQNSYVNFSGINDEAFKLRNKGRALRKEGKFEEAQKFTDQAYDMMKFAPQKVGLLPDEFVANPYLEEKVEKGEPIIKEQIDAVKIISSETPRKRAKKMAVAEVLNGFAESQLSPESSEQDLISRFLNNIFEESLYTLKKGPRESGMTWYIEDITEFENKMKVLLPELSDPNQMKLFKQVLAITSSGTNPNQNLQTAYTLWLRSNGNAVNFAKNWGEDKTSFITKDKKALGTGIIVRETKTKYIVQKVDALGNLETFKNGQPKLFEAKKSQLKEGYPKPAGFTSRGSIVAQQLEKIEQVYKDVDGDISKLVEFFEKPQPVSQLRKYNEKVPDVKGDTKKVAVGKRNGAFIFGEKIGAFYQNMIGIGDTITMDLWWSRTWNRYMGTMISVVKGKEEIQETPRTDRERDVMRKAVTLAAKKLNLDVSELQAVIWYFEQELWTKAGNVSPSFSYVTAVEALNTKIKTDEQTQKRFSEAGADLTAAEKRRQDAIVRANNIIAQGGIQGAVKEQIDFAGIEMKVKETPASRTADIPTGGIAYVPVSTLYNLMDMRDGDRGGLYETARDKNRVNEIAERFKKEGYNSTDGWYQPIYIDIDAGGFGWIGEGNHRVLAARKLGMTHLPVKVEFGAARDGKFVYNKNWSRVPTQVVTEEKIEQLKEQAGPYYHIKYASIWETNLPTNQEPKEDAKQQIDWQPSLFGREKVNTAIITRSTQLQQAVQELLEGKITNAEYQEMAKLLSPVDPISQFFLPASDEDMENALGKGKAKKLNVQLEDGEYVGLRLDIPAYVNNNIWVVTAHKGTGAPLTYGSVAWATDVKFGTNPKVAAFIAAGKNMDLVGRYRIDPVEVDGKTVYKFFDTKTEKYYAEKGKDVVKNDYKSADRFVADRLEKQDKSTIGKMLGRWKNFEGKTKEDRDASAIKKVEEIVKIENSYPGSTRKGSPWRQIGMNPFRHSFFYDRRTGKPVVSAAEVVQIGGLVYAKDVEYADWSNDQFTVDGYKDADGQPVKFQIEGDAESKVDNEVFKALEKGEIPAPLYKKTWYQKLHSALFRTELETEVLKLQEKKEAQISDLEYQAREIANRIKKYAKTPEALKLANEYLTTEDKKDAVEAIKKLPAGQKLLDDLRVARAFIDNISEKFVKEPAFDGLPDDLRFAIQNNITTYLRTSYRFFTDKSYNIDKKRKPAIEGEFNRLVAQEIGLLGAMGMSKLDISNTINERRDEFVEEATQIIDSYISDLQDIKYQPSTAGVGIKMPNAPFRRKKDLPDYIKQLLGEDKNPVNRFAQTSKSLANVYYKNQMINGIIKLVGKNSDYILDEEPVGLKSKKYKKVNDPYSLLDGKWVHNDIIDMVDQKPLFTSENPWINGYYNVLKLGRKSKVIWNVTTWRKNLTGGWYFILANGIVNPTFYKDFARRTKLMFSTTGEKFQVDDQTKTLMRIMAEKGVSGKSIDANMIGVSQAAMQFAIDGDENAYFARTKRIFNNIAQKDKWLQEKYAAVDDYTKLVIFRSEIESYAKKLYGKNYEQLNDSQKDKVHEEAAERVKQSTPTFSRLPKWYNKIAWIPIVGDFISFRLESLRSYGSNVANAVSDIKKSQEAGLDEVQRKEYLTAGLRRLAGSGAVFALKLAITKVLTQWFLDDDDEKLEEDVKNLRPDWMDGQSIIPRSIDKDGNVRVYNYSSEDPYGDVSDVFGGPESWGAMLQDFIRPNIAASLIFNLAQGEDIYGRNIADYSDSRLNNMLKIMSYTGKQIIVPPTVSSSFRDAWVKSELPVKDKAVNLATTIAERSLIRDYKYNVVDSFVQDLRKISGTRKTYVEYDDPTLRLKQLDDIKNQFNSIVAIGLAKRNYEMIDKAERLMKRHLGDEDQDYVLDGILIKK